jgi:two-component system KDP operon response regulator KdpE
MMIKELDIRRAEQLLRQAESAGEALLDALTDEIAVVDSSGNIIAVNEAWKRFARSGGDESLARTGVGQNYLDICEKAATTGVDDAAKALAGLREVLRKSSEHFVMEYEFSTPGEVRWFVLTVTSLAHMPGALVSHRDVTARWKVEEVLRLGGQIEVTSPMFESFLPALVKNLAVALNVRNTFLSELVDSRSRRARLLAHWHGRGFGEPREYRLEGIPSEQILAGRACVFPSGVQKLFPEDQTLVSLDAESYMAVPLLDSSGGVLGHLGVIDVKPIEDVPLAETTLRFFAATAAPEMERRRMERQLSEQSRMVFSAPDAIVGTDRDFFITYWNEAAEQTYGWRANEVLGRLVRDVLQTEYSDEARAQAIQTVNEIGEYRGEVVQYRKDGSSVHIGATTRAVRDSGGRITGYVSINRDITDLLQAQRALRESELTNRAILEASPDMIFTVDARGHFLTFIPSKELRPYVPASTFIGKTVEEVMPADLSPALMNAIATALRSGQVQKMEYQLVEDGEVKDYEARIVPIGDDRVVALVRDYTAQKRRERELEERLASRGLGERTVRRTGEKPCVLVVDRDMQALRFQKRILEDSGKRPVVTTNLDEGLRLVELEQPDVLLLDVALFEDGASSLAREIRRVSDAPIVVLGDRNQADDSVRALKEGADDYIVKPFSPAELDARVELALRHHQSSRPALTTPLTFGSLVIDPGNRLVTLDGEELDLTPTEYKLLLELAASAPRVMTHDEILDRVWGPGYAGEYEVLRTFIRSLRQKLGDDARRPRFLLSEHGVGYRMVKAA